MSKCENCIHYEVCYKYMWCEDCKNYKDKSLFVELGKDKSVPTNFDKITESVESLAEFIVEASEYQIDEHLFTYYNPALECSTSDKEEAIQHTIRWLQQEADND